ncbi:putative transmembrane protein [Toxoplasma gondii MAS]|uniref:Putative transmembrane protein n=1 Tax=Toxoplasma gondii MAS TaxID=943118 RepID=A0A086PVK5_TOXGO|nr:putative transmembrane protein [Toxoplasma gondii MAS]
MATGTRRVPGVRGCHTAFFVPSCFSFLTVYPVTCSRSPPVCTSEPLTSPERIEKLFGATVSWRPVLVMRPVAELFFSLVFFLFFSYLVAFACASNNGNSANGQHGDGDHGQGGGSPGSQTLLDAASGNGGAMGPDPSHPPQTAVPTDWRLPRPLQDAVIEEQRRAALRLREEMAAADVAAILEAIDTPWPEEKQGGGAEGAPFIFVDPSGFPEPWKVLAPYSVTGGPPFSDPSRERGGQPMIGSGVLGSVQTSRRRSRHRKKGTEGSGGPEDVRSEQPEVGRWVFFGRFDTV